MSVTWHSLDDPAVRTLRAETGAPAPMQQHPTYGRVMARFGRSVRCAILREAGAPVALAQVVGRAGLALISRGPLPTGAAPAPGPDGLRQMAARPALTVATPERPLAGPGLLPLLTPRHQAIWHLGGDAAWLRAALDPKWRNKLVRGERMGRGLTVNASATADAGWLYAAEAAQRRARAYRALPPAFAEAWRAADPAGFRLYEARQDGVAVAGIIVLLHRPWASYHIAWTGAEGRRLNANRLLLWRAARDLQDEGYGALDLGDVNTEDAPGLAAFKIGTGAEIRPLGATLLVLPAIRRRW